MTLAMSVMVAIMALYYNTESVMLAATATFSIVALIALLTLSSKFDITKYTYLLIVIPFAMFITWIIAWIMQTEIMVTVYCALGVCAFTVYLAYDMKLVIGGGRVQLSPDDYIIAVVQEEHYKLVYKRKFSYEM